MKHIYLAYGSNLNLEQMAYRCPDATILGTTVVPDYRLLFRGGCQCGVATIEMQRGAVVPALLWQITDTCEQLLDRYEGYPHRYRKKKLLVNLDGYELVAMAYIMNAGPPLAMPSSYYYATILDGYRDCGFDESILKQAVMHTSERVH